MSQLPPEVRAYLSLQGKKGGKKASIVNKKKPNYYNELSKKGVLARQKKRNKLSTDTEPDPIA